MEDLSFIEIANRMGVFDGFSYSDLTQKLDPQLKDYDTSRVREIVTKLPFIRFIRRGGNA